MKRGGSKMRTKTVVYVCALVMVGLFLSGCGCFMQAQKGETAPPPAPEAAAPPPPPAKEEVIVAVEQPAPPPAPTVMLKDINFDFDKSNIRPGDGEILKQDVDWFKANPGSKVRIEGNCDERGTIEYNLALGQRRADSTKKYLMDLGIDGKMLDTVSYGKERPMCMEHNEGCWAKNRRAHFEPAK
jgi:peptidoglycan-associated lipoprotein